MWLCTEVQFLFGFNIGDLFKPRSELGPRGMILVLEV